MYIFGTLCMYMYICVFKYGSWDGFRHIDVIILLGLLKNSSLLRCIWHKIGCAYFKCSILYMLTSFLPMKPSPQARYQMYGSSQNVYPNPSPPPLAQSLCLSQPLICFLSLEISLPFVEMCVIQIRQYFSLFLWLLSLRINIWMIIHM